MKRNNQKPKKKKNIRKKNSAQEQNGNVQAVSLPLHPAKKKLTQKNPERTSAKKAAVKRKDGGNSIFTNIVKLKQFLRESKVELRKVKWPTRKELIASTSVVIVFTVIISLFLGLMDFSFIKIIKIIVG